MHVLSKIDKCVKEIKNWMTDNKLQLNEDKTEVIMFGTKAMLSHLKEVKVKIGDCEITPSTQPRNLGVIFDAS